MLQSIPIALLECIASIATGKVLVCLSKTTKNNLLQEPSISMQLFTYLLSSSGQPPASSLAPLLVARSVSTLATAVATHLMMTWTLWTACRQRTVVQLTVSAINH